jgi:hypothetical protein
MKDSHPHVYLWGLLPALRLVEQAIVDASTQLPPTVRRQHALVHTHTPEPWEAIHHWYKAEEGWSSEIASVLSHLTLLSRCAAQGHMLLRPRLRTAPDLTSTHYFSAFLRAMFSRMASRTKSLILRLWRRSFTRRSMSTASSFSVRSIGERSFSYGQ